jgi:hypothetical protein
VIPAQAILEGALRRFPHLNEQAGLPLAADEAHGARRSGIAAISRVTGLACRAIDYGLAGLSQDDAVMRDSRSFLTTCAELCCTPDWLGAPCSARYGRCVGAADT